MATGGRLVVITGVTRGLGRALATRLAEGGQTVIGCGRDARAIEELADSLTAPHAFSPLDVTDTDGLLRWAEGVISEHGGPDLLVNNAAVINRSAPLWELEPAETRRVIEVNVLGTMYVLQAFLPAMVAARSGVVVNISSGWGRTTAPEVAPYCASKFAIEGLSRALAQEVPRDMAVVALNPGVIDTGMLRSAWGDGAGAYPAPEEWASRAAPMILRLGPRDNGKSLSV